MNTHDLAGRYAGRYDSGQKCGVECLEEIGTGLSGGRCRVGAGGIDCGRAVPTTLGDAAGNFAVKGLST